MKREEEDLIIEITDAEERRKEINLWERDRGRKEIQFDDEYLDTAEQGIKEMGRLSYFQKGKANRLFILKTKGNERILSGLEIIDGN